MDRPRALGLLWALLTLCLTAGEWGATEEQRPWVRVGTQARTSSLHLLPQ